MPQFGYRGDMRFLGALGEGPLPLDRPHQVKVFGNYEFPIALNVGGGLSFSLGQAADGAGGASGLRQLR